MYLIWCVVVVHTTILYFNQQLLLRCGQFLLCVVLCCHQMIPFFISFILINRWHFQAIYLNQMIVDWLLNQRFVLFFVLWSHQSCVCFLHGFHGCCTRLKVNESFSHFKLILSCRAMINFLFGVYLFIYFFLLAPLLFIPFHSLSHTFSWTISKILWWHSQSSTTGI